MATMSASDTSETNCGAAARAQDQHFASASNWLTEAFLAWQAGNLAGNTAASRGRRFNCMFVLFFRRHGCPTTTSTVAAGRALYEESRNLPKGAEVGRARQPFLTVQPSRQWQALGRELQP